VCQEICAVRLACGQLLQQRAVLHEDEFPRIDIPGRRRPEHGLLQQLEFLRLKRLGGVLADAADAF